MSGRDCRESAAVLALALFAMGAPAANFPPPFEGDLILKDFHFQGGQTLPELRMHYLTLGQPERDRQGVVRNAVLILHGTTSSSAQFLVPQFAHELYGPGQPLDATRYYLVIPDNLGHGKSAKPSDGLRAQFPNYGYRDMIEAQYRLLTEGLKVTHLRLVLGTYPGPGLEKIKAPLLAVNSADDLINPPALRVLER